MTTSLVIIEGTTRTADEKTDLIQEVTEHLEAFIDCGVEIQISRLYDNPADTIMPMATIPLGDRPDASGGRRHG